MIQRWTVVVMRKTRETWLVDAERSEDAEELVLEKGAELLREDKGGGLLREDEVDAFVQRCDPEEPEG